MIHAWVLQTSLQVQNTGRLGKLADLSWLSLPQPLGTGCVLTCATSQGSIGLLETLQTVEQASQRQRLAPYKALLSGVFSNTSQV